MTVLAGLVFGSFVAWAILQEDVLANPTGITATVLLLCQVGLVAIFLVMFGIGFRPEVRLSVAGRTLRARQGDRQRSIRLSSITGVEEVDARTFHRVYHRYAGVVEFSPPRADVFLLLHRAHETVALGLTRIECDNLVSWIERVPADAETGLARLAH
ncbi:MAG: hypothetical protein R3178_06890 [Rhodothermales bacterium]|nr:hypothetical protein [Rhodothermales bacterium]